MRQRSRGSWAHFWSNPVRRDGGGNVAGGREGAHATQGSDCPPTAARGRASCVVHSHTAGGSPFPSPMA